MASPKFVSPAAAAAEASAPLVTRTGDVRLAEHEGAAHEKRNWVRLTFDCNNHCVFCLDTLTHDGVMRDQEEVKKQILEGRRAGATRLILSGGEPTMHPRFIDFIKLGKLAGYGKIQTVTNGRKFMYQAFLDRCLDAGLDEITFSLHGPNAKIHDALVGVKGAFEQETQGLKNALASRRVIVNVDIVINRGNVKHLGRMLDLFYSWGVREFDLLQVIPFGNAFREGKDILFYDLEEMRPYLLEAFEWTKKPDVHIWLNRFPPPHLEGYEHLIQDPYKLNDEVRGRKEEFARFLDDGIDLDCRDPSRCRYCYLERLCDTLYGIREQVAKQAFSRVRVDTGWESRQDAVFGGDPASAKRAAQAEDPNGENARRAGLLPLLQVQRHAKLVRYPSTTELVNASSARTLWVKAPDAAEAQTTVSQYPAVEALELELDDYEGLASRLSEDGRFEGRAVRVAYARTAEQASALLALPHAFEVAVYLSKQTAPWLLSLETPPDRLSLKMPHWERLTESADNDVGLREFFDAFSHPVPVEGVPACITGQTPMQRAPLLDTAMMTPEGRLEIFRYAKRYIVEHYMTKALRCRQCVHNDTCEGLHINYVRAHGYDAIQPVLDPAAQPQSQAAESVDPELPEPRMSVPGYEG